MSTWSTKPQDHSEWFPQASVTSTLKGYRPGLPVLLVATAIVVGAVLRFINLQGIPPALHVDEAVNGYDAYSLLLTGRDHHGHPFAFAGLESFGDWVSPLLTLLTVPAVGIFGLEAAVLRGVTAAIGVLAIPLIYLLCVELFKRRAVGVIAAWLIAVSPLHVHRSRFAIPPDLVPTMVALTMLLFVWTVNRQSRRGIVALGLAAGLTVATYPTMKLYVPVLLLAGLLIYRRSITGLSREAVCYGVILFAVITGPILYLSLADPGGRARLDQVSALKSAVSPTFLAVQYSVHFAPRWLFLSGTGHPAESIESAAPPGLGIELLTMLPFWLAGIVSLGIVAVRRGSPKMRPALLVIAATALYPIPGALTLPAPHLPRGIMLLPLAAVITAVGAVALADLVRRWLRSTPARTASGVQVVVLSLALVSVGLELAARHDYYFNQYAGRDEVLRGFQYGLDQAIGYAVEHEAEYDEIWIANANQPYIYLLFHTRWPPSDVHRSLVVRRAPPDFNQVEGIGKYRFGRWPDVNPDTASLVYSVADPKGIVVYEALRAEDGGQGQILLVGKPGRLGSQSQSPDPNRSERGKG